MNQNVEEIRERCETNTDNKARKEVCVTRIEELDDAEHEKSEEQMNKKGSNTKWRIFCFEVGADTASREEDERRAVANQMRKRDKSQRNIWTTCSWATRRKEQH